MSAHFSVVELDNVIKLALFPGILLHSYKCNHQFGGFLQYTSGLELLACSLDTGLNYVTKMLFKSLSKVAATSRGKMQTFFRCILIHRCVTFIKAPLSRGNFPCGNCLVVVISGQLFCRAIVWVPFWGGAILRGAIILGRQLSGWQLFRRKLPCSRPKDFLFSFQIHSVKKHQKIKNATSNERSKI